MASKRRPQRSCVVCRARRDKQALTRLVFSQERLRVDESGKSNGRGAYLCGRPDCWKKAVNLPVMSKALRRELSEDDREYLRQMTPS